VPRHVVLAALGDEDLELRAGVSRAVGDELERDVVVEPFAQPSEAHRRLADVLGREIVPHRERQQRVLLGPKRGRGVPDELGERLVEEDGRIRDSVAVDAREVQCLSLGPVAISPVAERFEGR
jgi:hypothetical protein